MLGDHKVVSYLDQWMVPRMMVFPEISIECLDFLIYKFIDNNLKMLIMAFHENIHDNDVYFVGLFFL